MTSSPRKRVAMFLAFVVMQLANASTKITEQELIARCERKTVPKRYPNCMVSVTENKNALWCDQSNYTRILAPNEHNRVVLSEEEAKMKEILYINDSCLLGIRKGDLSGYELLREFHASYNYITTLHSSAFSENTKLTTIDLSRNLIDEIEKNSFEGLSELLHLNLSNNGITELDYKGFGPLKKLKELNLMGNTLSVLKGGTFRHLTDLETLDLSGNKIVSIEGKLTGLTNLKHLFLDRNRLTTVVSTGGRIVLGGFLSLETLSISKNVIGEWPESGHFYFPHLRKLNLSINHIKKFTRKHLNQLNELRYLSLGENSLTLIEDDLFSSNGNLTFLNLSGNYIRNIPGSAFAPLRNLETLLLEDNKLEIPNKEWFVHLSEQHSQQVNIRGAHWDCNCKDAEFKGFVRFVIELQQSDNSWNKTLAKQLQITCSEPQEHEYDILSDLDFDNCLAENEPRPPMPATPPLKPTTNSIAERTTTDSTTTQRMSTAANESEPEPEPEALYITDAEAFHTAIYASLCSAIIIIIAAVAFCFKLKTTPWSKAKKKSKRKRNESSQHCIDSDPDITEPLTPNGVDPTNPRVSIDVSSRNVPLGGRRDPLPPEPIQPMIIPWQRTSRDSRTDENTYMSMNSALNPGRQPQQGYTLQQWPRLQNTNQPFTELEQYHTPTTVPKRLYSNAEPVAILEANRVACNSPQGGIPRRGSAESFKSCKDLSSDFQFAKRNSGQLDSAQLNFHSIASSFHFTTDFRDSGDGAEAQIDS